MHVSSTEPLYLRSLGHTSTLPEKYGVDFLWHHRGIGWCGVQRKEVKDFIASIHDRRLAKEVKQMQHLTHRLVVVEGAVTVRGTDVAAGRSRCPMALWTATLWGLQGEGVWVMHTDDLDTTGKVVRMYERWTHKPDHTALRATREAVRGDSWGRTGSRDFGVHLLCGLPGIGPEVAGRVYDHFGGVPWQWTVGESELCEVTGIGKVRAQRMLDALPASSSSTSPDH